MHVVFKRLDRYWIYVIDAKLYIREGNFLLWPKCHLQHVNLPQMWINNTSGGQSRGYFEINQFKTNMKLTTHICWRLLCSTVRIEFWSGCWDSFSSGTFSEVHQQYSLNFKMKCLKRTFQNFISWNCLWTSPMSSRVSPTT